jgi:hypothetical protein
MAHLVGVSRECLLVAFYQSDYLPDAPSGYYLGCFKP